MSLSNKSDIPNVKKCKICGIEKSFDEFYPMKSGKYGIDSKCKECNNKKGKDRRKEKDGLIKDMFRSQRYQAKQNKTTLQYSRGEFIEWVIKQNEFDTLYNNWVNSHYSKALTPSCYRIDADIDDSYTIANIGIATWKDVQKKRGLDIKNGIDNRINKPVLQYTKDGKFIKKHHSSAAAERYLQEQNNDKKRYSIGIINCKNEKAKSAHGYKWIEDTTPIEKTKFGTRIQVKQLENYLLEDIENILDNEISIDTEKEELIKCRIGQGKFRDSLIQFWKGCSVTDFQDIELLVASHIKPWRSSLSKERLDVYNGLLLTPNLDKLFDKGYISFDDNGKILISKSLENYQALGISKDMKINIKENHKKYLTFHREQIFKNI